jgi:hypothetical protein
MTIDTWLDAAKADAARRGLPELGPLLAGLAQATALLRAASPGGHAHAATHN